MSDHFFLLLNPALPADEDKSSVSWCRVSAAGEKKLGHGTLADAAQASDEAHVTVILPGQFCASYKAQLPGMNRRRQAQAVPFMLEEQLIDDIDDLHFALGETDDGAVDVIVVRRSLMDQWLEQLQAEQIVAQHLVVDYQTISLPSDGWHVWFDDNGIMLRTGQTSGMRIVLTEPMKMLRQLYEEADHKPTTLLVSGNSEGLRDELAAWCETEQISLQQESESILLDSAATTLATLKGTNLLQGSYSHKENMSRQWRPWWPAAAVIAMMVMIQLVNISSIFTLHSHLYIGRSDLLSQSTK